MRLLGGQRGKVEEAGEEAQARPSRAEGNREPWEQPELDGDSQMCILVAGRI